MINEKKYQWLWVAIAFIVFFVASRAQFISGTNAWPFDWLSVLPKFLLEIISLIFWIGAGPLVLCFIFLVPIRDILLTMKIGVCLALMNLIIYLIADITHIQNSSIDSRDLKILVLGSLGMLCIAIPLFLFIVLIPQIIIKLLKRGN